MRAGGAPASDGHSLSWGAAEARGATSAMRTAVAPPEPPDPRQRRRPRRRVSASAALRALYGDITDDQLRRALWLGTALALLTSAFWILRSLKSAVLDAVVGIDHLPSAKLLGAATSLAIMLLYNALVDRLELHRCFFALATGFSAVLLFVAGVLALPSVGMDAPGGADPSRAVGWVAYAAIESYGSVLMSVFWGFVNSHLSLEEAERVFGLVVGGAQVGAIAGTVLVSQTASTVGVPRLMAVGALLTLLVVLVLASYTRELLAAAPLAGYMVLPTVDDDDDSEGEDDEEPAWASRSGVGGRGGMLDGLRFLQHRYVTGILATAVLLEVPDTILDTVLNRLAAARCDGGGADACDMAELMGYFGLATNVATVFVSMLGTSVVVRALRFDHALALFPALQMLFLMLVLVSQHFLTVFVALVALKALAYGLNGPLEEMLYQPTATVVKTKTKSWIDVPGSRLAKAAGAAIVASSSAAGVSFACTAGALVSGTLMLVNLQVGRMFKELVGGGAVVGG